MNESYNRYVSETFGNSKEADNNDGFTRDLKLTGRGHGAGGLIKMGNFKCICSSLIAYANDEKSDDYSPLQNIQHQRIHAVTHVVDKRGVYRECNRTSFVRTFCSRVIDQEVEGFTRHSTWVEYAMLHEWFAAYIIQKHWRAVKARKGKLNKTPNKIVTFDFSPGERFAVDHDGVVKEVL